MGYMEEAWRSVLDDIKDGMTVVSQRTFENMTLVKLTNNEAVLAVESRIDRNRLQNGQHMRSLKKAFRNVTDNDLEITFITSQELADQIKAEKSNKGASFLNPRYTFDSFVVGPNNNLAHAGAVAVAQRPGESYNPLFIYGGAGLGKTHLLHAIGHQVCFDKSSAKLIYVTCEKFINEFIDAIEKSKNVEFRSKYRNTDVLMIDDIQFLIGKERTCDEFFHTFNELHEAGKQIVITSDRQPKELRGLAERLRSRFEWGLIVDVSKPDYETKVAIIRKKAELDNIYIPNDVIELIATSVESNIRELEGSLTKVRHYSDLLNKPITLDIAREALKTLLSNSRTKAVTPDRILEKVSDYYCIEVNDIKTKNRTQEIAFIRQLCMYLIKTMLDLSYPQIGSIFNRHHSTVIHAYERISADIANDIKVKILVDDLIERIKDTSS